MHQHGNLGLIDIKNTLNNQGVFIYYKQQLLKRQINACGRL